MRTCCHLVLLFWRFLPQNQAKTLLFKNPLKVSWLSVTTEKKHNYKGSRNRETQALKWRFFFSPKVARTHTLAHTHCLFSPLTVSPSVSLMKAECVGEDSRHAWLHTVNPPEQHVCTSTHTDAHTHSWTSTNAADQSCIYGSSDGHHDNMTHGGNFSPWELPTYTLRNTHSVWHVHACTPSLTLRSG